MIAGTTGRRAPGDGHEVVGDVGELPDVASVLAVVAHPDDESFGLGALLSTFAERGARTGVLCFTHGEASTLGVDEGAGRLEERRVDELAAAAAVLGVEDVTQLDYPDGALASVPPDALAAEVEGRLGERPPDLLLVFDDTGITGHPDHRAATAAALGGAGDRPVLAWTLDERVAERLNAELATSFAGHPCDACDLVLDLDRHRQLRAIACHGSQSADNPVLWRRLELQGGREVLRWLAR